MKKHVIFFVILVIIYFLIDIGDGSVTKVVKYNGNKFMISIDGKISSTLPTNGIYYLEDYECKSISTKLIWDKDNYSLKVSNSNNKGGVTCNLVFKSKPKLSEMAVGSYVAYNGNNGCDGTNIIDGYTSCSGKNANYVSDVDMGYCLDVNHKFHVNGWRIGYVEDGNVHLISAGATDCICTDSAGNASSSSCSSSLSATNLHKHFENMNDISLKYCNSNYAKFGICDSSTSWAMQTDASNSDFKKIIGKLLSSSSCYANENIGCGYTNDLIDNGGGYWIATAYTSSSTNTFIWDPEDRRFKNYSSDNLGGVRPVLALDSSVVVTGGDGTYENPYEIANYTFRINDGASYIAEDDDKSNVQLSLIGHDVATMCISVNTSVCTNYVAFSNTYTLDLSNESAGENVIYVYYKDTSGNIIASINKSVTINTSS